MKLIFQTFLGLYLSSLAAGNFYSLTEINIGNIDKDQKVVDMVADVLTKHPDPTERKQAAKLLATPELTDYARQAIANSSENEKVLEVATEVMNTITKNISCIDSDICTGGLLKNIQRFPNDTSTKNLIVTLGGTYYQRKIAINALTTTVKYSTSSDIRNTALQYTRNCAGVFPNETNNFFVEFVKSEVDVSQRYNVVYSYYNSSLTLNTYLRDEFLQFLDQDTNASTVDYLFYIYAGKIIITDLTPEFIDALYERAITVPYYPAVTNTFGLSAKIVNTSPKVLEVYKKGLKRYKNPEILIGILKGLSTAKNLPLEFKDILIQLLKNTNSTELKNLIQNIMVNNKFMNSLQIFLGNGVNLMSYIQSYGTSYEAYRTVINMIFGLNLFSQGITQVESMVPQLEALYQTESTKVFDYMNYYYYTLVPSTNKGISHIHVVRQLAVDICSNYNPYCPTRQQIHAYPRQKELDETIKFREEAYKAAGNTISTAVRLMDTMIVELKKFLSQELDYNSIVNVPKTLKEKTDKFFAISKPTLQEISEIQSEISKVLLANHKDVTWFTTYGKDMSILYSYLNFYYRKIFQVTGSSNLTYQEMYTRAQSLIQMSSSMTLLRDREITQLTADLNAIDSTNWQEDMKKLFSKAIEWQLKTLNNQFKKRIASQGDFVSTLPVYSDEIFDIYNRIVRTSVVTEWDALLNNIKFSTWYEENFSLKNYP